MSHQYAEWGQSSWNDWWWQELQTEVARLGRESNELTQRVEEVEGQKALLLEAIAELRREVDDLKSGVAGAEPVRTLASAAGAGERPVVVAQSVAEASTGDGENGRCEFCHGGTVLDRKKRAALKEKFKEWPLSMHSWPAHLGSTLFSEVKTSWPDIHDKLTEREGGFLAWGSTAPGSREYVCQCCECKAIVTAKYGRWQAADQHQHARDVLALFLLGHRAK